MTIDADRISLPYHLSVLFVERYRNMKRNLPKISPVKELYGIKNIGLG
jgi:hypothetical protein